MGSLEFTHKCLIPPEKHTIMELKMLHYLYIDPYNPNLKEEISKLQPTSGYCFFIDIVESTEIKDRNLQEWIIIFYNTFANILGYLYRFNLLKISGDQLMFFVPENAMRGETPLTLYSKLWKIINSNEYYLKHVKIAAAYCKETYNITFIKNVPDVYGKDIDLTARLLSIAQSQEIVMNSDFVNRVRTKYNGIFNKEQFSEVEKIIGPISYTFKGFTKSIDIFRAIK